MLLLAVRQRRGRPKPGGGRGAACRIGAEVFVAGGEAAYEGRPGEMGTAIMKLTTTTQVSVDGVMQGNGGPDTTGGFERGGWARPLFDSEATTYVDQVYQRADAFLFGRRTYELFAAYWGGVRKDLKTRSSAP